MASECDLKIPTTLCSQKPEEIYTFLHKYEEDGTTYQPMSVNTLNTNHAIDITPTDYFSNPSPGIFQRKIDKKYELRLTCFGDYIVAVKLHPQLQLNGQVDWRAMCGKERLVELWQLPGNVEVKVRSFMRHMGIVFGSFDLVVNNDDEYVFLNLNEQGQFLWIEELNPSLPMLDIFIQFLLNKNRAYVWQALNIQHSIEAYLQVLDEESAGLCNHC